MLNLVSVCRDQLNKQLLKANRFLVPRVRNKDLTKSDSENTNYLEGIREILATNKKFNSFRRSYRYREILEHVSYPDGAKYMQVLNGRRANLDSLIGSAKANDSIGRPLKFYYKDFCKVSPTTLRYLKVASDIQELFGRKIDSVVEVGAEYGGQASVLLDSIEINSYFIYDLPEAQALINRYLQARLSQDNVKMLPIRHVEPRSYDLVISNYAFSELPFEVQKEYCEKVFTNCKSGYLTMNSGLLNSTGRSDSKMILSQILNYIPKASVYHENPLTGPDNYMIVWGNSSDLGFKRMKI